MMPAVGNAPTQNVPMRSGSGTSAVATGVGRPEMHGDNPGGESGNGFGSVMTAALANASQHHAAINGRQVQKSAADTKEAAVRDAAPGAQRENIAGAKAENAYAAKVASANAAGPEAGQDVGADTDTVKARTSVAPAGNENHYASGAATSEDAAELLAAAKPALPGLQVDGIAAQHPGGSDDGVPISGEKSSGKASTAMAGWTGASAGRATKPNSKKVDAKDSAAKSAIVAPNGMALPITAVAKSAPAPTAPSKATAADSRGSAKGRCGAVAAASKHDAVAAGAIVAKNIAGAITQPEAAADARASSAHTGASVAQTADGKSNTAPATASGAARSDALAGNSAAGVAATPGAGVQPAVRAGLDAQHAVAQGVQGASAPGTKNTTAFGLANSGASPGNGFTAALLSGHPGTAQTAVQPQTHAAAASSGATAANPYARMDETHAPSLVYASPQKMSVVVSDPLLGNFQVRAQSAGAQVAASLATASAATHAQLSGQLPSLTAFLQEQRVNLPRVTVVQQSMLGGDSGARGFGREQQERSGSSSSRGTRSQRGRVGAVGTSAGVSAMSGAAELHAEAGVGSEAAVANSVSSRDGIHGAFSYVDVHA